ncbi:hypothetical protein FHS01_005330 [Longimicrobium terrae]|uniref:Uncharacterized protein n=1 Tax=Longimicrobium terrae TaxID=1639882 RepID=A0A841H6D0_9BACT|nr:hypothetical protein [Longimicrobium terrae]MBB6073503.1 hypothetical protein [Longimicrobium terrae]
MKGTPMLAELIIVLLTVDTSKLDSILNLIR